MQSENQVIAERLRKNILEIEQSRKKRADPDKRIIIVHVNADDFLRMAYLFVGVHGSIKQDI